MIALLIALATVASAERPIVDAELSSQCEIAEVAIYASGFAHFQVSNSCGTASDEFTSGLRKLSSAELRKLEKAISKAGFDSLPERIEPDPKFAVSEEDLFSIRVWRNGVAKRVGAFGLDRIQEKGIVQRFQALWQAIMSYGPGDAK